MFFLYCVQHLQEKKSHFWQQNSGHDDRKKTENDQKTHQNQSQCRRMIATAKRHQGGNKRQLLMKICNENSSFLASEKPEYDPISNCAHN